MRNSKQARPFGSIEGYDAMASGEATELSGVTVIDPYTIEIKLSRPDATFLHVMAINFSSVVPKEVVEAAPKDARILDTAPMTLDEIIADPPGE